MGRQSDLKGQKGRQAYIRWFIVTGEWESRFRKPLRWLPWMWWMMALFVAMAMRDVGRGSTGYDNTWFRFGYGVGTQNMNSSQVTDVQKYPELWDIYGGKESMSRTEWCWEAGLSMKSPANSKMRESMNIPAAFLENPSQENRLNFASDMLFNHKPRFVIQSCIKRRQCARSSNSHVGTGGALRDT